MTSVQRKYSSGVVAIVLAYAFFGGMWILLSDRAMGLMIQDPETLVRASMFKGWFYVAVTTLLLAVLMKRFAASLFAAHQRELDYERERKEPPPMLVAIADASADAIFAKDSEGRYLLFNNAASRFVGKGVEEIIGKGDSAFFPAAQAATLLETHQRIFAAGVTISQEEVLQTVDGERVFFAVKGPLRGADGRIFGTYGISRDITDRKQAERQLEEGQARLRLLFDHAPVGLAMFDRNMCYLEASQRWRDDYLLGETDIIGRSHYEVSPEVPESWKAVHQRALAGEIVSEDDDRFERGGRIQWLRWEVRPWFKADGTVGGIVIFSEDISQRRISELELRQRNQELERFNRSTIDRELRMVELKRQVNEMAQAAGRPAPYDIAFASESGAPSAT